MDVAIVSVGRKQKGIYSHPYQCVKVKDLDSGKILTLNIGARNSAKFKPFLTKGTVFYGVQAREDMDSVIDVVKGFISVKFNKEDDANSNNKES